MENNNKRKRPKGGKQRKTTPRPGSTATGGERPPGAPPRTARAQATRTPPPTRTQVRTTQAPRTPLSELGITLNSETARQAIILSEIIGKPVSKRKRTR